MKRIPIALLAVCLTALAPFSAANEAETVIELTGNDQMRYNKTSFEVPAGEPIKMVFTNVGKLPKAAMGHNVVILHQDGNIMAYAGKAATAAANDYIPQDEASQEMELAHTKLLGPGETDTITFTLPEPGTYPFLCSFPGHFALMQGTITAK